ncbi:hypothetical protein BKA18_004678 [Streptomyces auratus]
MGGRLPEQRRASAAEVERLVLRHAGPDPWFG